MKLKLIALFLILFSISSCSVTKKHEKLEKSNLNSKDKVYVSNFLKAIKSKNPEKIANFIQFPLRRKYPIPDVIDKADFVNRFDEILDNKTMNRISETSAKYGWYFNPSGGISSDRGTIWMDYGGKVFAINCQTKKEKQHLRRLDQELRKIIYPSLRNFKQQFLYFETTDYKIQIDLMKFIKSNGGNFVSDIYRCAVWSKNQTRLEEPILILNDGKIDEHKSFRTSTFISFKDHNFNYELEIFYVSELGRPSAQFRKLDNGKILIEQDSIELEV